MIQMICLGWILGICFMGKELHIFPELSMLWVILLSVLLIGFICIYLRLSGVVWRIFSMLVVFLIALLLGQYYAQDQIMERLKYRTLQTEHAEVIVFIAQMNRLNPASNLEKQQQPIHVLNQFDQPVIWLASLKNNQETQLNIGQYYRLTGEVYPAHGYATAGAFDVEKWYLQNNWMANFKVQQIELLSEAQVIQLGFHSQVQQHQSYFNRFQRWVEQRRLDVRHFIQTQPLQHQGLTLALLTGDQSLLTPQIKEQFQRLGMSHLLAISGPHVLIFASLLCWLLYRMIQRYRPQIYLLVPKQYILILPFLACVFIYCAYVGFEIPALRTLIVTLVVSIFILLKRPIRALTVLLLSAAILLVFDPFSILSAAFWLSYGACFVLLRIYQTIQQKNLADLSIQQKLLHSFSLLIESQWKIFVALLPLMIIFFQQVAWISPLTNLFAIPILSLIVVPLDVLAGFTYLISAPLSVGLFHINQLVLTVLMWLVNGVDQLLMPQLLPVAMNIWLMGCMLLMLIILFLPRGVLPQGWSALCIVPLVWGNQTQSPFELTLLDVGQGQAIMIRTSDQTLMVDTGGYYDEEKFSVATQIIQPYFSVEGIRSLDYLFLTHLDQDHSGAYEKLKQQFHFQTVYSSEQLNVPLKTKFQYCEQGQKIHLSQHVTVEVLSPTWSEIRDLKDKNENSCVLYIQVNNALQYKSYLLMGDAGWLTEYKLLQQYPNLTADVLVLGHHGSRHSSSYAFLRAIQPKLALISAGFQNRYNHPHPWVLTRLEDLNIPWMSTIHSGSITFKQQKNGQVTVEAFRAQKLWLQVKSKSLD